MKGVLTIMHAAEIRGLLRQMIAENDILTVRISDESEADLAFLQLLCSACMTARKTGKSFSVSGTMPEKYRSILEEAGYARKKGCRLDTQGTCIWILGDDRG